MIVAAEHRIPDLAAFRRRAQRLRYTVMEMIGRAGSGHVGGAMSVIEILLVLYDHVLRVAPAQPDWPGRDRFVMSKGHAGPALYAVLAEKGYFPARELRTLNANGTNLPSHCDMQRTPGIDMTTGSLGQGLSAALGAALGLRLDDRPSRVWCLLGCGECNEGQVWEAAMAAAKYRADNLVAIVDYNRMQIDGVAEDVMPMKPFAEKWRAFGWDAREADGHDPEALLAAFGEAAAVKGRPAVVIAHTVKGRGVSYAEGQYTSHNIKMNAELTAQALKELAEDPCD